MDAALGDRGGAGEGGSASASSSRPPLLRGEEGARADADATPAPLLALVRGASASPVLQEEEWCSRAAAEDDAVAPAGSLAALLAPLR